MNPVRAEDPGARRTNRFGRRVVKSSVQGSVICSEYNAPGAPG
jgi:hypothetical protein